MVRQRRGQARQALRGQPVYGVNTGMGALSSVRLTEEQQRSHQRNLLLARAAGGPPWLSRPDARAIVVVRLLTFLTGDAAVSDGLCQRLADLLNYGIVPAVPEAGAGTAGEITQLAHAFGPLAGIGRVLGPDGHHAARGRGAARPRAGRVQPGPEGGHRPDPGGARGHRAGRAPPR